MILCYWPMIGLHGLYGLEMYPGIAEQLPGN